MWESLAAAGISGLANIFGGAMSAQGQAQANAANIAAQQNINDSNQTFQNNVNVANWAFQDKVNAENFAFAREQTNASQAFAREQMGFQERMSGSAYQRAMQDMRLAGLNPILAYSQGGASTPSGAMGSAVGTSAQGMTGMGTKIEAPRIENTQAEFGRAIGRAANSAVDAYRSTEQARYVGAQRDYTEGPLSAKTHQDAKLSGQSTEKVIQETYTEKERNKLVEQQAKTEAYRQRALSAQSAESLARARHAHGAAANEELRNREARPTTEGGHGRGTGVGPSFPERLSRQLEDLAL